MSKALEAEWSSIEWSEIQTRVIKLQTKIYEASKSGNKPLVVKLQKTLISSFSARLVAVRRVTQENKGKRTAGIDGIKSLTPQQRVILAEQLRLDGKSSPLRRVEIPKPGKKEKRPLGIPTIEDRAKQALAKLALEPEWEALFEPNSYGFRPGRSCHDAIEAIELSIRKKPKYLIDADLKGCFDNIDHEALIQKLKTFPDMETQIRAWLKSGVLVGDVFHKTISPPNFPQGRQE
ncbi:MAG: retron-type reverse transcriptase [Oscillatoriales cyanobacterium]|nr:MAG: retron-type reverse transcriptase [Oscillatoriales cyanobacterium]